MGSLCYDGTTDDIRATLWGTYLKMQGAQEQEDLSLWFVTPSLSSSDEVGGRWSSLGMGTLDIVTAPGLAQSGVLTAVSG